MARETVSDVDGVGVGGRLHGYLLRPVVIVMCDSEPGGCHRGCHV